MVHLRDFRDAQGRIDWKAYRLAQQLTGERCPRCRQIQATPIEMPNVCAACRQMDENAGPVIHPARVRCPHCAHQESIEAITADSPAVNRPGVHSITCVCCGLDSTIETIVHYEFQSLAREEEDPGT